METSLQGRGAIVPPAEPQVGPAQYFAGLGCTIRLSKTTVDPELFSRCGRSLLSYAWNRSVSSALSPLYRATESRSVRPYLESHLSRLHCFSLSRRSTHSSVCSVVMFHKATRAILAS